MAKPFNPQYEDVAKDICKKLNLIYNKFVGNGAFKETFKATTCNSLEIALKIVDLQKISIDRTTREINAIKKCDCPYISKIHEYGQYAYNGTLFIYIIEEFYDDGCLTDRLKYGKVPISDVKKYAFALIKALEHLKTLDLVHRDIKPDNIMFSTKSEYPSLVDFGLVRDLSLPSLTMSWMPQGPCTPYYSSPEQLNNEKHLIKWRSDQFSIGIVLGICLTGKHPFQSTGMNISNVVNHIANRLPCSNEFIIEITKMGFKDILKMLSAWPVQRYINTQDILNIFN
ncbi:MAG: serine/threonine protein kinase [Ignavibacteriae bacterium]|nr:MAG: serine/threonine protein kinase [Ignavibacteriota bacterium]